MVLMKPYLKFKMSSIALGPTTRSSIVFVLWFKLYSHSYDCRLGLDTPHTSFNVRVFPISLPQHNILPCLPQGVGTMIYVHIRAAPHVSCSWRTTVLLELLSWYPFITCFRTRLPSQRNASLSRAPKKKKVLAWLLTKRPYRAGATSASVHSGLLQIFSSALIAVDFATFSCQTSEKNWSSTRVFHS